MKRREKNSLSYRGGESSENSVLRVAAAGSEIVFDDCTGSSEPAGNAAGVQLKDCCELPTWRIAGPLPRENFHKIPGILQNAEELHKIPDFFKIARHSAKFR